MCTYIIQKADILGSAKGRTGLVPPHTSQRRV